MRNLKQILLLLVTTLLLVMGCDQQKQEKPETNPASSPAKSSHQEIFHVFSFDGVRGFRYLVHFAGPGLGATLFTQDEVRSLALVPESTGNKYADDRLMIWLIDDEVIMEVDGKRVGPCKVSGLQPILAKAWLSGGTFWAVGNEPAWNLVMGPDRVILILDGGQNHLEFPGLTEGQLNPKSPLGVFTFANETNHLEVEILEGLCTNSMSGEPFAVSVKITLDQKEFSGCGTGLF